MIEGFKLGVSLTFSRISWDICVGSLARSMARLKSELLPERKLSELLQSSNSFEAIPMAALNMCLVSLDVFLLE
jgi:hypothetical protein